MNKNTIQITQRLINVYVKNCLSCRINQQNAELNAYIFNKNESESFWCVKMYKKGRLRMIIKENVQISLLVSLVYHLLINFNKTWQLWKFSTVEKICLECKFFSNFFHILIFRFLEFGCISHEFKIVKSWELIKNYLKGYI